MTAVILRRRKLGRTSAREISGYANQAIKVVRNFRVRDIRSITVPPAYVFRWGCTSQLPEGWGQATVVNIADSISWCADKRQGRLDMQAAGISVPETAGHYHDVVEWDSKVVVRPSKHAQGRQLYVFNLGEHAITTYSALTDKCRELGSYYISELIDKVAEYRVFVCQGRAVWVANKTPGNPDQVAWNVAQGGSFDNVRWGDWNIDVVVEAIKAAEISGTDFCGVDVMVDREGVPYVLEVNSAPSQTSPYRQQCVAKAFAYIIAKGKQHFPALDYDNVEDWKDVIHPAVRGNDA